MRRSKIMRRVNHFNVNERKIAGGRSPISVDPPCQGGFFKLPQLEPQERTSAQRRRFVARSEWVWSQVAASCKVLSGRKDLLWLDYANAFFNIARLFGTAV